jgi:hypothetical protein
MELAPDVVTEVPVLPNVPEADPATSIKAALRAPKDANTTKMKRATFILSSEQKL